MAPGFPAFNQLYQNLLTINVTFSGSGIVALSATLNQLDCTSFNWFETITCALTYLFFLLAIIVILIYSVLFRLKYFRDEGKSSKSLEIRTVNNKSYRPLAIATFCTCLGILSFCVFAIFHFLFIFRMS